MHSKIKILSVILGVTMLTSGVSGCAASSGKNASTPDTSKAAGASSTAPDVPIRYVINNLGNVSTIEIGLEKGFFKEGGVDIETAGVAGGGAISIQQVLSGKAELASAPFVAVINAVKGGGKLKMIYDGTGATEKNTGTGWLVLKDSGINSAKDLVGKKIAMGALGANWEFGTREYLKQAGISADQVTMIVVPPTQHEQVLNSKQADVVVTGSPVKDKILAGGKAKELASDYSILGTTNSAVGYEMSQDFLDQHPQTVKKLIAALIKTDQWIESNPEEAQTIVAKVLKERNQNPDIANYWRSSHLTDYGIITDEKANFWLDWFIQLGKIKKDQIKPSDLYTNEYNPYYKK